MEEFLCEKLGYESCKAFGHGGGGCISSGHGYVTDRGRIFVKSNSKDGAKLMFEGEFASLSALKATDTITVPTPVQVIESENGGAILITEHLDMNSLSRYTKQLGTNLANLHLHNTKLLKEAKKKQSSVHKKENDPAPVEKFGFDVTTCCGYLPQDNTWENTWPEFYARRKLQQQMTMVEQNCGDREALELWSRVKRRLPDLFTDLEIVPALLHGDLWSGNAAENKNGPVIFDPASFYGHHEFDLGIASMFGGFASGFWSSYHSLIPKDSGWKERNSLYQLFHYLNHWNHFGGGYRGSSISIMKDLA